MIARWILADVTTCKRRCGGSTKWKVPPPGQIESGERLLGVVCFWWRFAGSLLWHWRTFLIRYMYSLMNKNPKFYTIQFPLLAWMWPFCGHFLCYVFANCASLRVFGATRLVATRLVFIGRHDFLTS
jgi:hypothetical protein